MKEIVLSVHGLVDFLLRRGSIDNRIYNNASMAEGTRIHLRYQQIQNDNYLKEEELKIDYEYKDFLFHLSGRADGIIIGNKYPIIDEIKSTVIKLEDFYNEQKEWHLGQALVYAFIYASENELDKMGVRLTYISQLDKEDKLIMNFTYSFDELKAYFEDLLDKYLDFYKIICEHDERRIATSSNLEFPYKNYRNGQRELAKFVYGAILNEDSLFVEAPTGIGKTMSTLFPACKSFATAGTSKIFYLSAKNIAKEVAYDACKKLLENGLDSKVIKLTSKEKLCLTGKRNCNPDECPFALNYYNKIQDVIRLILKNETTIDDSIILEYANKYEICPFEMQLDVSLYIDIIICDYNYIFDPLVYLKRYFELEQKTPYVALIDESHNLVDRSRDMYSTFIDLSSLVLLQKQFKRNKHPRFKRALKKLILYIQDVAIDMEEDYLLLSNNFPDEFYDLLENYFKQAQDILKNYSDYVSDLFTQVFVDINRLLKISDFYNSYFKCYFQKENDDVFVHIRCVDSSILLEHTLKKLKASIFFSATLTPMDYYVKCLGGNEDTPILKLESPFPKKNCLTLIRNDISTRYKDRTNSYLDIARTIEETICKKVGNYLVFFSSYQYLENVFEKINFLPNVKYIKQTRDMDDTQRHLFLNNFIEEPSLTTVGFAVLGGVFSEGIDLNKDKLIGAIIVGVGIPQISFERNLIKSYYDEQELNGYDYSYVNPGITKIIQAAGRVIRSENDVGIVVFIDDRFKQFKYQDILKKEYRNSYFVSNLNDLGRKLEDFWKR
ncbi:MAG: ATP-dependent DNA helicase [Bacillales bacterium]|nr:ATP-dependent DNA helicase [Bacillales bacterium]